VAFSDAHDGWALIGHQALLATRDGGHTWTAVVPDGRAPYLVDVAAVDSPSR